MVKVSLAGLTTALVLLVGQAPAAGVARQELTIPMSDGVPIAATLYLPDGAPPAGGWPAVVFLHGLAQDRSSLNALVESYGFAGSQYAVLTFDARGHGSSGGRVGVIGRELADIREVRDWLAARPDVSDDRIGAWGLSYGGGGVLNSLVSGVPWRAVAVFQTWVDLYSALMPQGLVKSGLVVGLSRSIPAERRDPSLDAVEAAAFAGNAPAVQQWAQERSSFARLGSVTTPVFMAQGRRDFLFGIDQGTRAFARLGGVKTLYLGLHGHAPSTFPAADTGHLMTLVRAWFDCHLRAPELCDPARASVYVAPESFSGRTVRRGTVPPVSPTFVSFPGVTTFSQRGKAVRTSARLRKPIEIFGTPTVQVGIGASGGWSRLVAVLTARTRQGKEILVAAGGVPTANGARRVTIRLGSQATFVPSGSRLTLTLASSSTAQASANLLYLDLPLPPSARIRVGTATLKLPGLRTLVTR